MKSTTTARMPETTLIRVTLSISSPQRGLAPLALQFPSTTFVDWLLDSVWLSCCLQLQGSFTSGSVMVLNGVTFINAVGNKVSVTLQVGHGAVSGDTFVTPEPGTLGLLGTGLAGIGGLVRRKCVRAA